MTGKATGFISTTRVTHASPANLYAHVADRNWESDDDLTEEAVNLGCTDIASQFIENAGFFKVCYYDVQSETFYSDDF